MAKQGSMLPAGAANLASAAQLAQQGALQHNNGACSRQAWPSQRPAGCYKAAQTICCLTAWCRLQVAGAPTPQLHPLTCGQQVAPLTCGQQIAAGSMARQHGQATNVAGSPPICTARTHSQAAHGASVYSARASVTARLHDKAAGAHL